MKSSSVTRALARAAALRFAIEPLATLRDLARLRRIVDDEELVAGHRHTGDAEHLHRNGRTCLLDRLAALVEQRADATGVQAADEVVADLERAVLHEHRRDGTLPRVELRFDDRAGCALRLGFALRSRISACSRICSSSSCTLVPFFAEIAVESVVPPNSSSTTPCCSRSC